MWIACILMRSLNPVLEVILYFNELGFIVLSYDNEVPFVLDNLFHLFISIL